MDRRYCNAKTINYIIKYVTKVDEQHKGYEPKILTSAGIGKNYIKTNGRRNKYNGIDTKEDYKLPNGAKTAIPIYYRNKIYTYQNNKTLGCQHKGLHKKHDRPCRMKP